MGTGASGAVIEMQYHGSAQYQREVLLVVDGLEKHLGMREPTLIEPIDFEAEIAERRDTHEPLGPVDGELGNTLFGV